MLNLKEIVKGFFCTPSAPKIELVDILRNHKNAILIAEMEDRLNNIADRQIALQTAVLEALARRPHVDAEFLNSRIVVLEMQVKDLSAKLLELSPELS